MIAEYQRSRTYGLTQTVAPTIEPVTWQECIGSATTWTREPSPEDASNVTMLITAAREKVEDYTGRQLITATWLLTLDEFPETFWLPSQAPWFSRRTIWLPSKAPWIAINSITYVDGAGVTQTMSASDYRFDLNTGRIEAAYGQVWPIIRYVASAVNVTFTSGYGTTAASVPAKFRLAIKAIVLDWLENRALRFDMPPGVKAALADGMHGRLWG